MDYMPDTLSRIVRQSARTKTPIPMLGIKLYSYQMFRALSYLHAQGICHRDIKPQNILVDPSTFELKICDFGSAKKLVVGEPNIAYICSRYYRAPELIFGATQYTNQIDVWSVGCVVAEMVLRTPIFPGNSAVVGDWGLGIGGLGIGPNPQSPIPNPQSPIPNPQSPIPRIFGAS